MGGCCCSSNRVEWNHSSQLYHYPVVSEDHQPLSSPNGAAFAFPTALLVDTNLDTSIPDTYRHPPAPLPYDVNPRNPHGPELVGEIKVSISGENVANEAMESDCKGKTSFELIATEEVDAEIAEIKKSSKPFIAPEECPTCLEEYDEENPKIITKCEHHFHLSCILEWMERSDTCPVCDQEENVVIFTNIRKGKCSILMNLLTGWKWKSTSRSMTSCGTIKQGVQGNG